MIPFFGTHPDPLSFTRRNLTFSVLARIPLRWYSPGSYTLSVLARILPSQYWLEPFSGTHSDAITFSILARIQSLFRYLPEFDHFFGTFLDSTLFRYLPRFDHSFGNRLNPSLVLTRMRSLLRYFPGFDHFSGTCRIRPFFGTCLDSVILSIIA